MAVSMVEIYNEQVRDLLCLDSESRLDIRQNLEVIEFFLFQCLMS